MAPRPVISDRKGKIYNHPGLLAAGMKAGSFETLKETELIRLPASSRLFMLPSRHAVGISESGEQVIIEDGFAMAAFLPPGYTTTYSPAYLKTGNTKPLPLYSYAACAMHKGEIHAAAIRVDRERRHDSTRIDIGEVKKGIKSFKKLFPKNRLIPHLERCAMNYGCCGAQNFFLGVYEGPLPTSPRCNSNCAGCISYQSRKIFPETQPRINFIPSPEEIAEVAVFHINNALDPVVSFGQGCEGEPLMAGYAIEKAIKLIRKITRNGVINMNTNASKPDLIGRLADSGLDSMRVSINSAREKYYARYYRPRGYSFSDVMLSIKNMKRKGGFVSLNYLTMPGFTDLREEYKALKSLLSKCHIDMIQWRNLNYDPLLYFEELGLGRGGDFVGIRQEIAMLRKEFPRMLMGYFNPGRRKICR
ncbi:MAG: radical SAM protein [Candidatus Omnitrophica bacterium]|nr:radical SAM protein [Candidatus Omnitrophota bacterium]